MLVSLFFSTGFARLNAAAAAAAGERWPLALALADGGADPSGRNAAAAARLGRKAEAGASRGGTEVLSATAPKRGLPVPVFLFVGLAGSRLIFQWTRVISCGYLMVSLWSIARPGHVVDQLVILGVHTEGSEKYIQIWLKKLIIFFVSLKFYGGLNCWLGLKVLVLGKWEAPIS